MVTVPDGPAAPAPSGLTGLTTALNVTPWPKTDGAGADDTAIVVPSWVTVWVWLTGVPALYRLVTASPRYCAVIVCWPAVSAASLRVAWPLLKLSTNVVAFGVVGSMTKTTEPVGVPPPGPLALTWAVKVAVPP